MASGTAEGTATLDSHELSFVRRFFKNGDVKSDGRISVAEVLACLEQMSFNLNGTEEDLVRSVVPGAAGVDRLSLNDAIKVATAAKAQDRGPGAPQAPGLGREDSLAELESSFHRQVMSGALDAAVIKEEPRTPSVGLGREDSLAQLESSFHRQVLSGDVPPTIVEPPQSVESAPPPAVVPAVGLDVPQRRRSIAGVYPTVPPSPQTTAPSVTSRRASLPATQGAEPVVVDNLPKRRASVARPGGASMVGLQAWTASNPGSSGMLDDDESNTLPASPELLKQSSEMELLNTAGSLGVEPVELESGPKKRRSFTVSKSWMEAAAQETAKASEAKKRLEAEKAEEERRQAESKRIVAEVQACLSSLADQVEHDAVLAEAKEQAEQRARAAALEAERAEAAAIRAEAETTLRLMVESLEREAAVAEAREEAERLAAAAAETAALEAAARVKKEAEAREAAEAKAAEAAQIAEEALRLVAAAEEEARVKEESLREAARVKEEEARVRFEEEERVKETARRALEEEAEALRSKLQEAGEEAAERAEEEAQERAKKQEEQRRRAEEQAEREASLAAEVESLSKREAEARQAAEREAKGWEEKFEALQREREEEARRAREVAKQEQDRAIAAAVEEAREFEKAKVLALRPAEERHPLEGATVSYENVDERGGRNWWQCVLCVPNDLRPPDSASATSSPRPADDSAFDDYDAMAEHMKPELWSKSSRNSVSASSMDRPRKGDVCSIM